ncbi:MAG: Endo,4-beta-xylanase precursor [Myxococcaceae bacterium]|nr:Endo,4-beta-xylanase precursor [Myxococcaceae bacterium]
MLKMSEKWVRRVAVGALAAGIAFAGAGAACTDSTEESGQDVGLDSAPTAQPVASLAFTRTVVDTFPAGGTMLAAYDDKDIGVFDLSDPTAPRAATEILTNAKVVGVEYDEERQIAYALDAAGIVWVLSVRSASGTAVITSLPAPTIGGNAIGITRVGDRLFLLGGSTLQPVRIAFTEDDPTGLTLESPIELGKTPLRVAAGGDLLYLAFAGGNIGSWTVPLDGAPTANATFNAGGDVRALLAKGSKVVVLSKGVGLAVVDFASPAAPAQLHLASELKDVSAARLFGRTLLVGLDRGALSTLDLTDFTKPRALTTKKGALPAFVNIVEGNVVFGSGKQASVVGVPPVVTAVVPALHQNDFPLDGQIPITFSKAIDVATVSTDTVKMTCNGQTIAGTTSVSLDRLTLTFRGTAALPAGVSCVLDVSGVKDPLGLAVASTGSVGAQVKVTTSKTSPAPVVNAGSKYKHTADGVFTDWNDGAAQHEWFDVHGAKGMYTYFYADFDGANLWVLNDWFYNGEKISPDCYNQFFAWTGGGSERWEIRAYGDKRVEVRKNGVLVDTKASGVEGGASFSASPNVKTPHTIYELKIPAAPGGWGVQLHDPGPTFNCSQRMGDPTQMQGQLTGGGQNASTVDTSGRLVTPPAASAAEPANDAVNVDLRTRLTWANDVTPNQFVGYLVQVATDASFRQSVLSAFTYEKAFTPRKGVLIPGTRYFWRVVAWNWGGRVTSSTFAFTTLPRAGDGLLTVTKRGEGSVTSAPSGIDCGATCSAGFPRDTKVVLTALAAKGSTFDSWEGACQGGTPTDGGVDDAGAGTLPNVAAVVMNDNKACTAVFRTTVVADAGTDAPFDADDGSVTVDASDASVVDANDAAVADANEGGVVDSGSLVTITSLSPNPATAGSQFTLTVTGMNLLDPTGSGTFGYDGNSFGAINPTNMTGTTWTVTMPSLTAGTYNSWIDIPGKARSNYIKLNVN